MSTGEWYSNLSSAWSDEQNLFHDNTIIFLVVIATITDSKNIFVINETAAINQLYINC